MASASDHRAHAALQPADCLILLPQRLPAAVETSIGPAHYPAECTQSDAFLQPSLRARYGRANSNSFCPVAMAAEILCTRWTIVLLRELVAGSTRFNELRRGVPRMSPALLSKRLKDLEAAGIVARSQLAGDPAFYEYTLTSAGKDLRQVVFAIDEWGQKWVTTESSLGKLDPNLLMWDMRRNISTNPLPQRRSTIQVIFS